LTDLSKRTPLAPWLRLGFPAVVESNESSLSAIPSSSMSTLISE
jgi:hypothetical protein